MLTVKVPLRKAQEVKKFLLRKGLFAYDYKYAKTKEHIFFPVTSKKGIKKRFNFVKFIEKKLSKVKKKVNLKENVLKKLTKKEKGFLKTSFDSVGSIAILEIDKEIEKKEKLIAESLLKAHSNIKTVLRKSGIHTGVFRTQKLKYLAGVKTKETVHKENDVLVKLNVEKVYFSVRLSNERKRIANLIKKGESVLVMFSGCGIYCLVISKNTDAKEVYGVEINSVAHKYAVENVKLNKLINIKSFKGDVRKVKLGRKFDRILMPLPKSADDFLDIALKYSKKGTVIHFYDFLHEKDIPKLSESKIAKVCKRFKKKYSILNWVKCGQHSPRTYRICVDFKIR